ncbi:hypothetical protein MHTCC0001_02620 [Flavobacteriaceae bacterium MHTCC 0001]
MKKIIYLLFISAVLTANVNAQDQFWHTDMTKASETAIEKNKPLLMFFTGSDWCGWCIRLQKEVFKTSDFKKWADENVVLVELDFPRRKKLDQNIQIQNYQLQHLFKVKGYPTVVFANPEKKEDSKMNLNHLGSTGYIKGGVSEWLNVAKAIIK